MKSCNLAVTQQSTATMQCLVADSIRMSASCEADHRRKLARLPTLAAVAYALVAPACGGQVTDQQSSGNTTAGGGVQEGVAEAGALEAGLPLGDSSALDAAASLSACAAVAELEQCSVLTIPWESLAPLLNSSCTLPLLRQASDDSNMNALIDCQVVQYCSAAEVAGDCWEYDDRDAPSRIVLGTRLCARLRMEGAVRLDIVECPPVPLG